MKSIYIDNDEVKFIKSGLIRVKGETSRHLIKSLRIKRNQIISVKDVYAQKEYLSAVKEITREDVVLQVIDVKDIEFERKTKITLLQGVLFNRNAMELVIEKAVELGVYRIVPVITQNIAYELKNVEKKVERWEKIAFESAKAVGRNHIPEILEPMPLFDAVEKYKSETNIVLWEKEKARRLSEVIKKDGGDVSLIVGPEGGLTEKEISKLLQNDFTLASLGNIILKSETAVISAISIIFAIKGDM